MYLEGKNTQPRGVLRVVVTVGGVLSVPPSSQTQKPEGLVDLLVSTGISKMENHCRVMALECQH